MTMRPFAGVDVRGRCALAADWLAVAVAVVLPWSTSLTSIAVVLWLIALVPTLQVAELRRICTTPAGGLPVLLVALAAVGMAWADVPVADRFKGLESHVKLLAIPLLFFQYMRSPRGQPVLLAFVGSVALLMAVSWLIHFFPQLPIHRKDFGVPAHDRILLSEVFVICAFCLAPLVIDAWQAGARWRALMFATLIGAWLLNVVYVTTARSAVVVMLALALTLGWRHATWRGIRVACIVAFVLGMSAWSLSHQIRERIGGIATEIGATLPSGDYTSAYSRVMFWIQSVELIRERPILGHGTGSIRAAFRRVAPDPVSAASNPHNQIFATGIQLGAVGIAALLALWLAHLLVFRGHGLVCWFGLVMVVQNIVASLFNSHLFDFGQGWLYVFGVGVLGGMAMRERILAVPPEA